MGKRRFFNQTQPQTLQIAVMLLYFRAGLTAFILIVAEIQGRTLAEPLLSAVELVGFSAAAYGIANERRWGYLLGIFVSVFRLASLLIIPSVGIDILGLLIAVALVALLVHPQSRDYQRIWFK